MATLKNPSSFFSGGGQIAGDVEIEGDLTVTDGTTDFGGSLQLSDGTTLTYPDDSGIQNLVDLQVTSSPSAGTQQSYSFQVDGTDILRIEAEADGAGGIQNEVARVPVDFIVTGSTTEVDDVVTGDITVEDGGGNVLTRFDATVSPQIINFNNDVAINGDGVLLEFGANQDVSISYEATPDVLDITGKDVRFSAITGVPTFGGHNHSSGGMTLIGIAGIDDANGLEDDGTGAIQTQGDAIAGSFLSEGASAYSIQVNLGNGVEGDGSDNIRVDEDFSFTFTSSINFTDDTDLAFGTNSDFAINYESSSDELVISDSNGIELIRQPKGGSTEFLQGIDAGSIEAPEDSFTQVINTSVTSSLTAGDRVGYTFAVDNITGYALDAEADGSGGLQDLEHRWYNSGGTERMRLDESGNLSIEGTLTEGAAL